jgi:hypothetical protein
MGRGHSARRRVFAAATGAVVLLSAAASASAATSKWVIQTPPNPPGGYTQLNAVSCTSGTSCIAVGQDSSSAVVEGWTGGKWKLQSVPSPSGGSASDFNTVTCISASDCEAIGNYGAKNGDNDLLAEVWNGSAWAVQPTPPNPSGTDAELGSYGAGIACTSATSCIFVGSYHTSAGSANDDFLTLAESWNGTKWTVLTTPNPSGTTQGSFSGVSCTSATSCIAVGSYDTKSDIHDKALAEYWNGSTWAMQSMPSVVISGATTNTNVDGVSCTSASSCMAAGYYDTTGTQEGPIAEYWNGSTWTVSLLPAPSTAFFTALLGISCTSASSCTAAGSWAPNTKPNESLIESWNGSKWSVVTTPNPKGSAGTEFLGISCPSVCTAVGEYSKNAGNGNSYQYTLAEHN